MSEVAVDHGMLAEICQRCGIARLEVFGSVARGLDRPGSDVDLLYTLAPGVRLGWEIEDLAVELSALFGRPVDLVSRNALHPMIRGSVLSGARMFYATA